MAECLRVGVAPEEVERIQRRRSAFVEIEPDALYDSLETAILLGYGGTDKNRRSQVSAIAEEQLPRTPTGPRGGVIRFLGRDIIDYLVARREARLKGRGG